jgi:hypothetical protein
MNKKPQQTDSDQPVLNYSSSRTNPVAPSKLKIIYNVVMFILAMVFLIGFVNFIVELIRFHD